MTKEQERKALEKIAAILEETGEDSYLNITFAGILEQAEENITNDFAINYKEMYDQSREVINRMNNDAIKTKETIKDLEEQIKTLTGFHEAKASRIDELNDQLKEASDMIGGYIDEIHALKEGRAALEQEIIALKAKLYDLMTA